MRFHEELRRNPRDADPKTAGADIDALVKRERGDHDQKAYRTARASGVTARMPMAAKVSQIRAIDIPESDILNFMSDNLTPRCIRERARETATKFESGQRGCF